MYIVKIVAFKWLYLSSNEMNNLQILIIINDTS